MFRTFSSIRIQWGSRALAAALVVFIAKLAAAAPSAQEKTDAKESPALFRAYLPTIRLKALRDNEGQSVADLERWLNRYNVWLEGGLVNQIQRGQIDEEYHRSRLRALRLDTDYRDSLDQFTSRFRISEERRRQMEDAALLPMTMHLRRFEELSHDSEAAHVELNQMDDSKYNAKVRPQLVKILTESALVKNTTLPKRFLKRWRELEMIDDTKKLMEKILKVQEDLHRLREKEMELLEKPQKLTEADRQRRADLKFELFLGELQLGLLYYEEQPWKNIKDGSKRLKQMRETFFGVCGSFQKLLDHAYAERLEELVQSWPRLAPVKIKDVDLLACKRDKAEETVASLLKTPDAQREGRKKIRRLRTVAESYPIQQRLFQLAFLLRENRSKWASSPPPDNAGDIVLPGLVGPIGPRPQLTDPDLATEHLLKAEAAYTRVKRQLLQSWIDYQMLRLDLYGDLSMSPPER